MSSFYVQSSNIDLKPKRHHGYAVVLFIMGTLFPPLAVAARFGIGRDFWINLLLTICGYIPGHGHNFYIQNPAQLVLQNIRNNKNHARTPKWAQRYGLVDTSTIERHQRRSQWANRYNDRLPRSTLEGQPVAEGQEQEQASSVDLSLTERNPQRQPNGDLWRPEDESYYNPESSSTRSSRWHYPANFEDAALPKRKKENKVKKDRWAMTEDAYSQSQEQGKKSRRKKKKSKSSVADDTYDSRDSVAEFPEDPEGGLYADHNGQPAERKESQATSDTVFQHQF
ncbi:hypothetical protein C0993_010011 [Termitomyces sp. T159_Od127]|nr:hypothetical protein C0993_010011 [Termitomyces sp. T159_Od127]